MTVAVSGRVRSGHQVKSHRVGSWSKILTGFHLCRTFTVNVQECDVLNTTHEHEIRRKNKLYCTHKYKQLNVYDKHCITQQTYKYNGNKLKTYKTLVINYNNK